MDDKQVLAYKDVVLKVSDLDVLRGPCYLNDQIIDFYFTYLSSSCNSNDILLVPPSISFWLANSQDESLNDFIDSLKLSTKRMVLLTVNDNDDLRGGESGTHWSLLVYVRTKNAFLHHDSMEGVNHSYAFKLYEALKGFMGSAIDPSMLAPATKVKAKKKKDPKSLAKSAEAAKSGFTATVATTPIFVESSTTQQTNGYDCGLYVIAIARAICRWYSSEKDRKGSDWQSAIQMHVDESLEMTMRCEVLKLIEDLQKD